MFHCTKSRQNDGLQEKRMTKRQFLLHVHAIMSVLALICVKRDIQWQD